MSQNETEKLLAMLDSMEEAISTNHWPTNDPAGAAQIQGAPQGAATAGASPPVGPWGQPAPSGSSPWATPAGQPSPAEPSPWGTTPGAGAGADPSQASPWGSNAGGQAANDPQQAWGAGAQPAGSTPQAAPVPRPDAAPLTAARPNYPDQTPKREGYTPTRGATAEVLASIPWVPES